MEDSFEVAVIGGGIAGAALGSAIAHRRRVAVIEGESQPGRHATGRSAAVFSCINGTDTTRALSRASLGFFRAPPEGFAPYNLLRARGCLWAARSDQVSRLDAIASLPETAGRLSRLDGEAARKLCPALRPGYVHEALFEADGADIDVDLLHQGYLRRLKGLGGRVICDARIERLTRTKGRWRIETPNGTLSADIVINAAGAWADEVARLAGARPVGLVAYQRTALLTDAPEDAAIDSWPMVIDIDEQFYFKPDAGLVLFSPADASRREPYDAQPEMLDIAIAVDRLQKATTIEAARLRGKWAGLRTFTEDRAPVIGFDPDVDGFFWFAGQGGSGIQTSPALSALAASELLGEEPAIDPTAFGVRMDALRRARFERAAAPAVQPAGA